MAWLAALVLASVLGACGPAQPIAPAAAKPAASAPGAVGIVHFLESHWARPLAPQGALPTSQPPGLSLAAQSCGTCHAAQFEDWSKSLHSRAMGPGLMGQLVNTPAHARDDHQDCLRCHAPLAEQADALVSALETLNAEGGTQIRDGSNSRPLHEHGLVCAGCHVRKGEWYGPPRRDGSESKGAQGAPHGGWMTSTAFESSRFCSACHQFGDDGYALNGKLLENTFKEWEDSRYAREGASCQSCHMPDRRHLWRGIHDPEMARRAVKIVAGGAAVSNGRVASQLSVANIGAGHFFPTYVTPRVLIRAFQKDANGRKLQGTEQQFVIGRHVPQDLSREIADTRIAPDATAAFDYSGPRQLDAAQLVWQVEVQPDAFYLEMYQGLLRGPQSAKSRRLITQARDNAAASPYLIFDSQLPLR
jgi:hypothetical protein